jgi:hypothetical protein
MNDFDEGKPVSSHDFCGAKNSVGARSIFKSARGW